MVSLLNSQEMKSCKMRDSFYFSILTIYTNDWSTFGHVYWCLVYFFFSDIPKYVQAKIRLALSSIGILWKWSSKPTELAGDGKYRLTQFHPIRNFLANEIYHFSTLSHQTGCIFTWTARSI